MMWTNLKVKHRTPAWLLGWSGWQTRKVGTNKDKLLQEIAGSRPARRSKMLRWQQATKLCHCPKPRKHPAPFQDGTAHRSRVSLSTSLGRVYPGNDRCITIMSRGWCHRLRWRDRRLVGQLQSFIECCKCRKKDKSKTTKRHEVNTQPPNQLLACSSCVKNCHVLHICSSLRTTPI